MQGDCKVVFAVSVLGWGRPAMPWPWRARYEFQGDNRGFEHQRLKGARVTNRYGRRKANVGG
jgi:hypothetical protein